jgi:hypothetical protein
MGEYLKLAVSLQRFSAAFYRMTAADDTSSHRKMRQEK